MKRSNKKGFTIVELVVVIAVIAVLAAVMIPTFSGVIGKANDSALKSELKAAYTQYTYEVADNGEEAAHDIFVKYDGKYYLIQNGDVDAAAASTPLTSIDDKCTNATHTVKNAEGEDVVVPFVDGKVFERLTVGHSDPADDDDCTCDICGKVVEASHVDEDDDNVCDVCEAALS